MARYKLRQGDCLEIMPTIKDNGIDAIVCDPPYGYNFMGKDWDHGIPGIPFWKEALRVAKPGAHLLAFGGTRTHHRLMVAIEDAGWELRDTLMWVYGSGMPKGHDISKAIDKMAGVEREVVGKKTSIALGKGFGSNFRDDGWQPPQDADDPRLHITAPATDAAKQWDGWNTNLKPAWEIVILARKPISEKTVTANVLKWGTGAINIGDCKIAYQDESDKASATPQGKVTSKEVAAIGAEPDAGRNLKRVEFTRPEQNGRWPANLILDEEAGEMLDQQSGKRKSGGTSGGGTHFVDSIKRINPQHPSYSDSGGASRFFYCAKVSKSERGEGNDHPTVKPISLMRYLCKLVTPPNGIILDPFMGSGSTGLATLSEGFLFYGIELDEHYFEIASKRIREIDARTVLI